MAQLLLDVKAREQTEHYGCLEEPVGSLNIPLTWVAQVSLLRPGFLLRCPTCSLSPGIAVVEEIVSLFANRFPLRLYWPNVAIGDGRILFTQRLVFRFEVRPLSHLWV
jgi:hypothetical protein